MVRAGPGTDQFRRRRFFFSCTDFTQPPGPMFVTTPKPSVVVYCKSVLVYNRRSMSIGGVWLREFAIGLSKAALEEQKIKDPSS